MYSWKSVWERMKDRRDRGKSNLRFVDLDRYGRPDSGVARDDDAAGARLDLTCGPLQKSDLLRGRVFTRSYAGELDVTRATQISRQQFRDLSSFHLIDLFEGFYPLRST